MRKYQQKQEQFDKIEVMLQKLIFIENSSKIYHKFVKSNIFKEKKILQYREKNFNFYFIAYINVDFSSINQNSNKTKNIKDKLRSKIDN